jgi:hypothetical protein
VIRRFAVLALGALVASSCAYDPPIEIVAFRVEYGGVERDIAQPFTVTTPLGWTVTLTAAQVSLGPMYFRNGLPGVGTDQDDGRVVSEVLAIITIDALNPNLGVVENGARGSTEPARTGEVRFEAAADGPIADAAGAGVAIAHVAGVAQRDSVVIRFDGTLALPIAGTASDYAEALQRRVSHIATDFTPAAGGTLTLRVDPSHWLDAVPFDANGTPPDFANRTTATQWHAGLADANTAFHFAWSPPASR